MDEKEKFWSDTPEAEEQRQALADASEQIQIHTKARTDALSLIHATPDEFWAWWGGLPRADDLNRKEIIKLGGPAKRGGGKSRRRKKPKKKIPEYLKKFGE